MDGKNKTSTESVLSLFRMPLEIREEIYYYVITPAPLFTSESRAVDFTWSSSTSKPENLVSDQDVFQPVTPDSPSNYVDAHNDLPDGFKLLSVLSRQIKREAESVLYSQFSFQSSMFG